MPSTILLVCSDEGLLDSRALLLKRAGYKTIKASDLATAAQLALSAQMVVIDTTFFEDKRQEFIDATLRGDPNLLVVCLISSLIEPHLFIKAVKDCFESGGGKSRICMVDDDEAIRWEMTTS